MLIHQSPGNTLVCTQVRQVPQHARDMYAVDTLAETLSEAAGTLLSNPARPQSLSVHNCETTIFMILRCGQNSAPGPFSPLLQRSRYPTDFSRCDTPRPQAEVIDEGDPTPPPQNAPARSRARPRCHLARCRSRVGRTRDQGWLTVAGRRSQGPQTRDSYDACLP